MIPLSFIVVEIFNKQHCCSKWQPGSSVAGWSPKYLFMSFYVSIVSLICLFFIVVEIFWANSTAAASEQPWSYVVVLCLKCLYMSIYVYTVSWYVLFIIIVEILGKQHCCSKWTALKLCCRLMSKIFIHVLICVYSIVDMSIIHYYWDIRQTALLQHVNSLEVMLQFDV